MRSVEFERFGNVQPVFDITEDEFAAFNEQVIGKTPKRFVSSTLRVSSSGSYDAENHTGTLTTNSFRRFEILARPIVDSLFDLGFQCQKDVELRRLELPKVSIQNSEWHLDNHVQNGVILLAVDILPTQVAIGETDASSQLVEAKKQAYKYYALGVNAEGKIDSDIKLDQEVRDELKKESPCLEIVNAPLCSLNLIPNDVVHRSPPLPYVTFRDRLMIMIEERHPS